ncbi:class I SAM-dependent methyltransferase [Candidatus Pelagibacter sp.]|nr:class I SAM-dependent methyltransferase [Candidatus Pelagibacter sp.]
MINNPYSQKNYNNYLYNGFIGILFKWQHKLLSPQIYRNCEKVLEIGPGFEPHIKFTKLNFKEYFCLEINKNIDHKSYYKDYFPKIIFDTYNGKDLNFPNNFFDRIVISHTLEHIADFENFLNEMMRVLKPGCVISIASPCDNGLMWRIGQFILKKTYHKYKKLSEIDYNYIMASEHINTIFQIKSVLKKKFKIQKELYLPFRIKVIDMNLIHICHIIK